MGHRDQGKVPAQPGRGGRRIWAGGKLLAAVLALAGAAAPMPAAASAFEADKLNWIVNGAFEQDGAWTQPLRLQEGPEGRKAACLENVKPAWASYSQSVALPEATPPYLEIVGRLKTEDVVRGSHDWEMARITVVFYDRGGQRLGDWPPAVAQVEGTHAWDSYSNIYQVPKGSARADISLVLDNCAGKAWFADLRCYVYDFDLKPLPAGASTHPQAKAPAAVKGENWLLDPDFEAPGSRDWTGALVAAEGHQSLHALHLAQAAPGWGAGSQEVSFKGEHPAVVVLAGWMRTRGVVRGPEEYMAARMVVDFRDAQGKQVGGWQASVATAAGDTPWTRYERRYPVPAGAVSVHVEAGLAHCAGEAWFDDLSLRLLDAQDQAILTLARDSQTSDTADWWSYVPPTDPSSTALDLSGLNEKPAGTHGFVQAKNGHFRFADGTRIRFWGTDLVGPDNFPDKSVADALALRLARLGVNLVRLHMPDAAWSSSNFFDPGLDNTLELKPSQVDRFDYLVAAMKKQGIYVYPDWMVARRFRPGDGVMDAEGLEDGAKGAVHFDARLIELNMRYARQLLGHANAYTKSALKDDPAYVGNEIVNESTIFCGFGEHKFPESYWDELQRLYSGSGGKGQVTRFTFDWDSQKLVALRNLENAEATLRFMLTTLQHSDQAMKQFQRSLSPHGLLTGSNMGLPVLGELEADAGMDFMDAHAYWDHPQFWNIVGGWSEVAYAPMDNKAQLKAPFKGSLLFNLSHAAVEGKPLIVTEWNDCFPNEYRLEGPVLMAAYASLQDWDGMLQFATGPALPGTRPENNFDINRRPDNEALYQAGALVFRRALLKASPLEVQEPVSDADVLANGMQSPWLYDHPWLPYAARVAKRFTGTEPAAPALPAAAAALYHPERSVIDSATGEEHLDYGRGLLALDSPQVQGFAGALAGGAWLESSGLRVRADQRNPWAAVLAVSSDERPLGSSGRILVFAVARSENSGQVYNATRTALKDPGGLPVLMQGVRADLELKVEGQAYVVRTLDPDGNADPGPKAALKDGLLSFTIKPSDHSSYYEVVRTR